MGRSGRNVRAKRFNFVKKKKKMLIRPFSLTLSPYQSISLSHSLSLYFKLSEHRQTNNVLLFISISTVGRLITTDND